MAKTWVYSDPHFYHRNIVKFQNYDGTPLRPWDDPDKMSEEMIEWYNELVDDSDRVYILGDVAFTRNALNRSLPLLKGRKILIKGNHDMDKLSYYSQYFEDVRAVVPKKGFVMTHVPLHPQSLERWGLNIHGHLHGNHITTEKTTFEQPVAMHRQAKRVVTTVRDSRYANVCVEQTNYRPKLLDEVLHENGVK